jgi:hypothetical protein
MRERLTGLRLFGFVFIAGIFGFGLWMFSVNLSGASVAIRSLGWPAATGEIIASNVCDAYSKTGTEYYPCIQYRYSVNRRTFEGDNITGAQTPPSAREDAEAEAQNYVVGAPVKVFYDPNSPATACLEPGTIAVDTYVFMAVGLGMAAFGLYLLYLDLKDLRRDPRASNPRAG